MIIAHHCQRLAPLLGHIIVSHTSSDFVVHDHLRSTFTFPCERRLERRSISEQAGGEGLWVPATSRLGLLTRLPDFSLVFLAELDLQRTDVLLNPSDRSSARDGEEVVSLGQDPGQGELTGGAVLRLCDLGDAVDELEVLGEVLGRETRCELSEVAFLEVVWAADLACTTYIRCVLSSNLLVFAYLPACHDRSASKPRWRRPTRAQSLGAQSAQTRCRD
jgi:hypothetical protein